MRRKQAEKRIPIPDPIYGDVTVAKFIAAIMRDGKKSTSERVFYDSMDLIEQRTGQPGVQVFKQALSIPVICVGGLIHREAMDDARAGEGCDMVSVARALIADPFLYRHMKEGKSGPKCDFCNACFARGATWPVDCYNEEIRAQRDQMLLTELV